ncbi:hypothetical protein GCM10010193_56050 [Kitasatospora atroaurantiaca]|uniref:Uncharacterized protein n=1 Tax=Kitasatospora atroaurantiaca TaxID=285545 RepID=A0A561EVK8_9ACTN|nr:hypothetical protein [Kitasatospora atroaurantiaca]TWE19645.1 hypothetical protein FB465_4764 [Kitasatospora atroaurantiaca]
MAEEATRPLDASTVEPAAEKLRLLPWANPDGLPCYLSTDGEGYLATLADGIEEVQLTMGEELLDHARGVLTPGARALTDVEYRWLACRLTEALSDALRVADSRGQRIPVPPGTAEADGSDEQGAR